MAGRAKVTVAGAGALGLTCALALADADCEVTVWDPAPGIGASAVAAGMIAPVFEAVLDAAAPSFDLLIAARDLWPAVAARAGVRLDRSGAMATGEESWLAGVDAALIRLGVHGIDLPRRAAEALAPGLSDALQAAVLVREDWRIDPRQALAALRRAAEAAGAVFREERVAAIGEADRLVIATGADFGLLDLAPELAMLTPIKGHILRLAGAPQGLISVRGREGYAVPMENGLVLGATMEAGISDPRPDPAKAAPLLAAGARLFPGLRQATPELFAGVRAATPDGLPLVGESATPKVILATGARRNGWLLAPLVAQTVAACITGREPGPYARHLDPARF